MVQSVLGSLVLAYRPLWGRTRALAGIELAVQSDLLAPVDTPHLLRTLVELWSANSPPLLLAPQNRQLLCDMLEHAPRGTPWIAVPGDWLEDSTIHARVQAAHRRGLRLVWRGELARLPEPTIAACFDNSLLSLAPEEAAAALQSQNATRTPAKKGEVAVSSPVIDGQMYENLPSRALVAHCLDKHGAMAVVGWPVDDVLYQLRHQPTQPSHAVISRLLKAIDADESLEQFEDIVSQDPLLAYRFMVYTNSAALGLRTGIDSLRRGFVMMGYGSLKRWLSEQLPHASTEPDMEPVRLAAVIRAQLTEHLLEAGIQSELRREIYLCGLLHGLGDLLGEPLGNSLHRIPLSERIYDATVLRTGPYAPPLEIALAFESGDCSAIRELAETYEMGLEEINRALLRVLSSLEVVRG
ncbi:MAG: HDOD domain-containing protein [Giesbergeria sp.]